MYANSIYLGVKVLPIQVHWAQHVWVVVNIRVPFGVLIIIRHLIFRVPKGTIILTTTHILFGYMDP